MQEGFLKKIFDRLKFRGLRIATLQTAQLFGVRNLLVRMDTNNICNLRCEMCPEVPVRKSKRFKPMVMKLEDFKHIAGQVFPRAHIVYLSCAGEPLVTPGFANYIKAAAVYRVPFIAFVTNVMPLREDVVDACIHNRISQIAISADGVRAESFEAIRTGASFSRLLEKLSLIRDMKKAAGSSLPSIRLNYIVSKPNWREVAEFVDLAYQYGADSIQFRPLTPFENTPWTVDNQLTPEEQKQVLDLLKQAGKKAAEYGIELLGHGEFTGSELQEEGSLVDRCVYPWYYRYIGPDGAMKVCPSRKPIGNLLEKKYADIIRSDKFRSVKREVLRKAEFCRLNCAPGASATEL